MKIFDLHADIGFDINDKMKKGEKDVFMTHHYPKLEKGDFFCVGVASFFEGHETWADMETCITNVKNDLASAKPQINQVVTGSDFSNEKMNVIMTVEGMCGIDGNEIARIDWMYEQGVRIASLCWNDENYLATGVRGNPLRGLSEAGKRVIKHMNDISMIIDISHTNENSFWDVLECSSKPVIATHSNARGVFTVERSLTDQQIMALAAKGGIIGVVAAKYFVHPEARNQDAYHLAQHAKYIADLVGVEHVSIGFDFMDFLGGDFESAMIHDVPDASHAQIFAQALEQVGFTSEEVELICYLNAENFVKKYLAK